MAVRIAAVDLETATAGAPAGRVASVALEVDEQGFPAGRVASVALEVAYTEGWQYSLGGQPGTPGAQGVAY